jgi:hypothetical protein
VIHSIPPPSETPREPAIPIPLQPARDGGPAGEEELDLHALGPRPLHGIGTDVLALAEAQVRDAGAHALPDGHPGDAGRGGVEPLQVRVQADDLHEPRVVEEHGSDGELLEAVRGREVSAGRGGERRGLAPTEGEPLESACLDGGRCDLGDVGPADEGRVARKRLQAGKLDQVGVLGPRVEQRVVADDEVAERQRKDRPSPELRIAEVELLKRRPARQVNRVRDDFPVVQNHRSGVWCGFAQFLLYSWLAGWLYVFWPRMPWNCILFPFFFSTYDF